jgi:hypothetical protein
MSDVAPNSAPLPTDAAQTTPAPAADTQAPAPTQEVAPAAAQTPAPTQEVAPAAAPAAAAPVPAPVAAPAPTQAAPAAAAVQPPPQAAAAEPAPEADDQQAAMPALPLPGIAGQLLDPALLEKLEQGAAGIAQQLVQGHGQSGESSPMQQATDVLKSLLGGGE